MFNISLCQPICLALYIKPHDLPINMICTVIKIIPTDQLLH